MNIKKSSGKKKPTSWANFKWAGGKFIQIDNYKKIGPDDLLLFGSELYVNDTKASPGDSTSVFHVPAENDSAFNISFTPNNFWALKKMIKHCKLTFNKSPKTQITYDFNNNTLLTQTLEGDELKVEKFIYSFDDESEAIIIDGEKYFMYFGISKIALTNERIRYLEYMRELSIDPEYLRNAIKN